MKQDSPEHIFLRIFSFNGILVTMQTGLTLEEKGSHRHHPITFIITQSQATSPNHKQHHEHPV
jgi:hypothetical protein